MCGIPVKAAAAYIAKLTKMGKKVAVVEQITEPSPGTVVEREVTKIVTFGAAFAFLLGVSAGANATLIGSLGVLG
ncbi:MAG: hypothetical protein IIB37_06650, partial [Gemmatimonadetes bacterium]|nr:hypothetical protein [Gemmatimonadota bacterium]